MIFIFSGEEMIYHVFTSNKNYMSCVPYFFSNFNIYSGFNECSRKKKEKYINILCSLCSSDTICHSDCSFLFLTDSFFLWFISFSRSRCWANRKF